jgi:hypothetical protein
VVFPHKPDLNAVDGLTVEMWVKLESAGAMPVLLCHGAWDIDGYFLQVLGGQLRFFMAGAGTIDAGPIQPGRWYHIAGTYDGSEMLTYINGELVGRSESSGQPIQCTRNLYIGRYDMSGSDWETECRITAVRIHSIALLPDEIRRSYQQLAGKLK